MSFIVHVHMGAEFGKETLIRELPPEAKSTG